MKISKLFISFLFSLFILSCGKDDAPSQAKGEEEGKTPYSRYMLTVYGSYVEIPHHPDLNPTKGMTWGGWIRLDTRQRQFFIYKLNTKSEGYFVGLYDREGETPFSSYVNRSGLTYNDCLKMKGDFPIHHWVHWAVTSDGTYRRHYLNGELVGEFAEDAGTFIPGSAPLLFSKSVPANTGLAEFRLWSLVRTREEIRSTMNEDITSPMPGLVAVWPFEENADEIIGSHHGTLHNNPKFKTWSE